MGGDVSYFPDNNQEPIAEPDNNETASLKNELTRSKVSLNSNSIRARESIDTKDNNSILSINDPEAVEQRRLQARAVQQFVIQQPFGRITNSRTYNNIQETAVRELPSLDISCSQINTLSYEQNNLFKYLLWDPFEQVVELNARGNLLSHLQPLSMKNLRILDLSMNQIQSLRCLKNLNQLVKLNVSRNQLKSIDDILFLDIEDLNASWNQIEWIHGLNNAKTLNLEHNELKKLECSSKRLQYVNISHNQLTSGHEKLQSIAESQSEHEIQEEGLTLVCKPNFVNLSFNPIKIVDFKATVLKIDQYAFKEISADVDVLIARWSKLRLVESNTIKNLNIQGCTSKVIDVLCPKLEYVDMSLSKIVQITNLSEKVFIQKEVQANQ
ncbi:leucine-rich_repeat domain-containing protein [Hexamita inflata]|uniref:Leucine-rich repeat domain-containing protein n=1 Tax=Hexamita inflata TaxID=28002 RepID=A0AA86Q1E8_9EUKA|nr:leucine-rich repeat domain-containing protein [Hexamita inflata]